jgi:glutamate 5-kinase
MGVGKLNMADKPQDMPTKQAAAAVGQCELMYVYDNLFQEYNHTVGQILITGEDLADSVRHENFTNTLNRLLELGALPIINENDTIATSEIAVGDNDTLGALVAASVKSDLFIVLTDIDGLYTADPRRDPNAQLISEVTEITKEMLQGAGGQGSSLGTGGMATKLSAAKIAMDAGVDMIIVNGSSPEIIYDAVDGRSVGRSFIAEK